MEGREILKQPIKPIFFCSALVNENIEFPIKKCDLDSMRWTKIEQEQNYLLGFHGYEDKYGGALYKDHLVIFKDKLTNKENTLCCLNLSIDIFFFHDNFLRDEKCLDNF